MTKKLTKRQKEVLGYIMQGLSNASIAKKMKIEEPTVKMHLSALFRAKGVKTRLELISKEYKKQVEESAVILKRVLRVTHLQGAKYIELDISNYFKKWGIK